MEKIEHEMEETTGILPSVTEGMSSQGRFSGDRSIISVTSLTASHARADSVVTVADGATGASNQKQAHSNSSRNTAGSAGQRCQSGAHAKIGRIGSWQFGDLLIAMRVSSQPSASIGFPYDSK